MSGSSGASLTLLVNIDVGDLSRATQFYTAGLGLSVRRQLAPNVVELVGGSSAVFLIEQAEGTLPCAAAPQPRDYRRHWTPVHL